MGYGLREYLSEVSPLRVEEEVSTKLEVSQYLRRHEKPILFERVRGHRGFRIVGNVCTSREDAAKILSVKGGEYVSRFAGILDNPVEYKVRKRAEFLENRIKNPDVARCIPLLTYYRRYPRRYASATIVLAKDPETGRQNMSFHRMMYLKKNRLSIRLVPRDLYAFYRRNKALKRDTPAVVVCGVHPAVSLAAATSYPNLNELKLASAFTQGKLECVDVGGIDTPADSEVVMTGRILHDEVAEEGPFVDLTGTWDARRMEPVFEADEVMMRPNPIWQVILPGGAEHRLLMGVTQEPRMFRIIQNSVPSVKNVVLTSGGCGWLHAVVSIRKLSEGEGKNAGIAALSAHPSLKRVVVVDDDIDISDPEDVEWALATRLQPSEGIVLIPGARGSSLDPSSGKTGVTTKWVLDATIPLIRDRRDFLRAEAES